jgi:hypothetical protein
MLLIRGTFHHISSVRSWASTLLTHYLPFSLFCAHLAVSSRSVHKEELLPIVTTVGGEDNNTPPTALELTVGYSCTKSQNVNEATASLSIGS